MASADRADLVVFSVVEPSSLHLPGGTDPTRGPGA